MKLRPPFSIYLPLHFKIVARTLEPLQKKRRAAFDKQENECKEEFRAELKLLQMAGEVRLLMNRLACI